MEMQMLLLISLVFANALSLGAFHGASAACSEPKLIDATFESLAQGLNAKAFTSVDLVNAYVARINEVNDTLHVVTELNPDAIDIAKQLDAERAQGSVRGPLHGMPILIKNNIATMDKMNNTAGSFALLGAKVPADSTMAAKLRKAGAVILGKANLSQWANFRSDNTSNGWSAYGGQVYGAYLPKQDPSGSSSGSAVSASIGLSVAALGTETDGSLLSPGDVNNLAVIKPTVGLTSRYLVIPISEHQDTIGSMARTVKDAAYLLQAIAGPDPKDKYTLANPNKSKLPDYVKACNPAALKGARLGIPRNAIKAFSDPTTSPPVLRAFAAATELIKDQGATVVDANLSALQEYLKSNNETILLEADFESGLKSYLAELTYNPTNIKNLVQLRRFTKNFPAEEFPYRDVGVWTDSLSRHFRNTTAVAEKAYKADEYLGGPGGLFGALNRNNLDALVLPTQFCPGLAAIVGAPGVTVPMGFYPYDEPIQMNGFGNLVATGPHTPFGLCFLGRRWSEEKLISYAYAYEQLTMTRNRVQPYIVPNIELQDVIGQ